MPTIPSLSARFANASDFPSDGGKVPDIGFSAPKFNGKAASLSLYFGGTNITDQAKYRVVDHLLHSCPTDTSAAGLAGSLNCGPVQGLRLVQTCSTMVNWTAAAVQDVVQFAQASAPGVDAHLTAFTADVANIPTVPCYQKNMQAALTNATTEIPNKTSGAVKQKVSLATVAGLALSAAVGVMATL